MSHHLLGKQSTLAGHSRKQTPSVHSGSPKLVRKKRKTVNKADWDYLTATSPVTDHFIPRFICLPRALSPFLAFSQLTNETNKKPRPTIRGKPREASAAALVQGGPVGKWGETWHLNRPSDDRQGAPPRIWQLENRWNPSDQQTNTKSIVKNRNHIRWLCPSLVIRHFGSLLNSRKWWRPSTHGGREKEIKEEKKSTKIQHPFYKLQKIGIDRNPRELQIKQPSTISDCEIHSKKKVRPETGAGPALSHGCPRTISRFRPLPSRYVSVCKPPHDNENIRGRIRDKIRRYSHWMMPILPTNFHPDRWWRHGCMNPTRSTAFQHNLANSFSLMANFPY